MKLRQLCLSALALVAMCVGQTAKAAEWALPTPQGSELVEGNTCYLYNTGAQQFLNKGNGWGTQATAANEGMPLKFTKATAYNESGDYYITFTETSKYLFRVAYDSKAVGTGVFVDGSSAKGDIALVWTVESSSQGDGSYILYSPTATEYYNEGFIFGMDLDRTYGNSFYYDCSVEDYPEMCNWLIVSQEAYDTYFVDIKRYEAAVELLDYIEKAEEAGVDASAARAVWENTNSTLEELNDAKGKLIEDMNNDASVSNPKDMTSLIVNPNMDEGPTGWSYVCSISAKPGKKTLPSDTGIEDTTIMVTPALEMWGKSQYTGKMYQTITNLPEGTYKFTLSAAVLSKGTGAYVYANNDSTAVNPNGEAAIYNCITYVDNGTLEIGMKQVEANQNHWLLMDNAALEFYGKSDESYAYMARWKAENTMALYAEAYMTKGLYNEYAAQLQAIADAANPTREETNANLGKIAAIIDEMAANVQAYKSLMELCALVENMVYEQGIDDDALSQLCGELPAVYEAAQLTTDELNAYIEKANEIIENAKLNGTQPGTDMSSFIVNPTFSTGTTTTTGTAAKTATGFGGWNIHMTRNTNSPNIGSGVAEVWNVDFRMEQTVKGLPNGVYTLTTQGFYATGAVANAVAAWQDNEGENVGSNEVRGFLFANDQKVPLVNVCSEMQTEAIASGDKSADGFYIPGDKASTSKWFELGHFQNELKFVVTDNTLTLGIYCENGLDKCWTIWDDFVIVYEGKQTDLLCDIMQETIERANELGENAMAGTARTELDKSVGEAEDMTAENNWDELVSAINRLSAAIAVATESVPYYATLNEGITLLEGYISDNGESARKEIVEEAEALLEELQKGYFDEIYANEDVADLIVRINAMIKKLQYPTTDPTKDQPLNYTFLIDNPDYAENKADYWTEDIEDITHTVKFYTMETWNKTAFDVYQDLKDIPNGYYTLQVNAFYRPGKAADVAAAYNPGDQLPVTSYIYANEASKAVKGITEEYVEGTPMIDQYEMVDSIDEDGTMKYYYMPNNQYEANAYFESGYYKNEISVLVTDGTLRIGIRNNECVAEDWTCWSKWTLYFCGDYAPNAIQDLKGTIVSQGKTFNLQGIEVGDDYKGIVIRNGKKALRK